MENQKRAGFTGKSFYAALSLSVAMVGAACWYAYSETGKMKPPAAPPAQSERVQPQTTAPSPLHTAVTTEQPAVMQHPETTAEEAEEAAVVLTRTTTAVQQTLPPPAETQAPVEQPLIPVEGDVLVPFSQGELIRSATTGIWQTHNGTDYAVPLGTEVRCTEDGTVAMVERDPLYGISVTLLHGSGAVTRYCGLNESLNVQAGDIIGRGTVIGTVGATNEIESAEEPHLHFEVLCNEAFIDPGSYFSGALNPAE